MGARWYAADIGRWVSPDPLFLLEPGKTLGSPMESGPYGYVRNDPVTHADLTGLSAPSEVIAKFQERVKETRGKDMGARPGVLERAAVQSSWANVTVISAVMSKFLGKDYELSRMMLHHYLVGDGEPLAYVPPEAVQKEIARHLPRPGHYEGVNPYGWGNPDIRNGLGHFRLDVVDAGDGKLAYYITDRYEFPDRANGKAVRHGFQIGKLSEGRAKELNAQLAKLGEFKRESGMAERFEVVKEKDGDYTLYVPQQALVDHGVDFESIGRFEVPASSGGR